jgi:chromosome segregation ATPase
MVKEVGTMDTVAKQKTLNTIYLRNFMCYQRPATIAFQPGVNAVTGPNDRGKSTLLAAVGWVFTGKPAGDTVESWDGERDVGVTLLFDDGTAVSRFREKGLNRYEINNGKVRQDFSAIGNSVPQEVLDALNLEEINFQGQANNLFPMQLTPGEFGALVNKHCRLDEIHTTMKRVAGELRQWDREITKQQATIDDAAMRLEELKWVPLAEGMVAAAEALEQQHNALARNATRVRAALDRIAVAGQELAEKKNVVVTLKKHAENVRQLYNKVSTLKNRTNQFYSLQTGLEQIKEDQQWNQQILQARPLLDTAIGLRPQILKCEARLEKVETVLQRLQDARKGLLIKMTTIDVQKRELRRVRESLPPICPLCGQPTKGKKK